MASQQVGIVWPNRSDGLIISLSLSGSLNYLYPDSNKPAKIISGHQKNITALTTSTSDSNATLWTGSYEGRLCSWDTSKGAAETIEGNGHTNIISGLAATPSSTKHAQVFSAGWDDTLRTIDASARTFTGASTKLSSQPKALTCTSDALVVVAQAESVIVYRDGEEDGELPLKSSPSALAATGNTVAIGADDSSLRLYTAATGKPPKQAAIIDKVSASAITALSFTKKGDMLAVGTAAGKIYVYKISSGLTGRVTSKSSLELVTDRWSAHTAKVTSIAWNDEGTGAVSGSLDTSIFLWSLAEPGRRVSVKNSHKEGVNGVAWFDGKVYSTGADASVKRWEVTV